MLVMLRQDPLKSVGLVYISLDVKDVNELAGYHPPLLVLLNYISHKPQSAWLTVKADGREL